MRTAMRAVMLLLVFSTGALAEDKTQLTASQKEAVSQVKSQAMKERQYLMNECKRILTQVAGLQQSVKSIEGDQAKALAAQIDDLQSTVKTLQAQLLKAPRYFDDPLADPLRP